MNQELKVVANEMLPVYENSIGEKFVDARELHEKLMVATRFNDWISRQIENYGFIEGEDFYSFLSKTPGRPSQEFMLLLDTGKEIAMVQNNEMGRAIRKYFIEVEKRFRKQQPQTIEDLIIMQAQSMKEIKDRQQHIEKQNQMLITQQITLKHRVDNMDRIDTIGDLQQRLNGMIRKYAQQEGLTFSKAYSEFRNAYNTAYKTNLSSRINNYCQKHGLKSLSAPQYLSLTNSLEDAIRVADKMLNQSRTYI